MVGVRSTAIDLLRALEATSPDGDSPERLPTGELLFEHSSPLAA